MCKLNATTKRPEIHDKCLLLEFSRVTHSELWCAKQRSLFLSVFTPNLSVCVQSLSWQSIVFPSKQNRIVKREPVLSRRHPNGTLPYFEQDLATFMLVRGPSAYLGYVWSGCTDSGCECMQLSLRLFVPSLSRLNIVLCD
jgi:hypothetical protein